MISLLRVFFVVLMMVLMVVEYFFFFLFFGVVVRREEDALCFHVRVVIARLHVSLLLRFLLFFSSFLSHALNPKFIKIPYPLIYKNNLHIFLFPERLENARTFSRSLFLSLSLRPTKTPLRFLEERII